MGKLTEFICAIATPAAELNRELYTHIDLRACNTDLIEARKLNKKAKKAEQLLF